MKPLTIFWLQPLFKYLGHLVSTEWGVQSRHWELEVPGHSFEWWLQGHECECQSNSLLHCRKLRNLQVYICKSAWMITAVTSKEHMKQLFAPFFHSFNLLLKWTQWYWEPLVLCLWKFRETSYLSKQHLKLLKSRNVTKNYCFLIVKSLSHQ